MNTLNRHDGIKRRGIQHVHIGHPGTLGGSHVTKRADCSSGGFYKTPAAGQMVNTTSDLIISWDTSCLSVNAVDIYLYAPAAASPRIFEWTGIEFTKGSFSTALQPKWWNNAASVNLQLAIVEAGTPAFLATLPAGPIFSAQTVNTTSSATESKGGMAKGAMAAAALVPIIVIALIIAGVYIKITRAKSQDKSKRWSEAIDRRMSTIATDWNPITASGATAAIRSSMAIPGNRASSFSFGGIRPLSTAAEGGHAGVGARAHVGSVYDGSQSDLPPQMSQLRPGLRTNALAERTSRVVSFADQPRPSQDSRRSRATSRAFTNAFVPPLPNRQDSGDISPVQREGALTLTADDIRARLSSASSAQPRPSVDEVMPALSMMRRGGDGFGANDTLLSPTTPDLPVPPTPTHYASAGQLERSPVMGLMPMQPMPASVMSPDDMLRQYAEARRMGTPSSPAPSTGPGGMRVLYSPPATPVSAPTPGEHTSMIPRSAVNSETSRYSVHRTDEDPYGGTA